METRNKTPRFMEEYAIHKCRCWNDLFKTGSVDRRTWKQHLDEIDRAVAIYKRGLTTIDETMHYLSEI